MNYILTLLLVVVGFGLMSFSTYNIGVAFAQEDSPSTMEVTFSIITTIIGMIAVLIPVIRRELIARNVQNPAIVKTLDVMDTLVAKYSEDQDKLLQMAEITYDGLSKFPQGEEFVNHIENKEKVKLIKLKEDLEKSKADYERFIQLYGEIRGNLVNEPKLATSKSITT